jgi:hypothetical protein
MKNNVKFLIGSVLFVDNLVCCIQAATNPDLTINKLKKLKKRELTVKDVYLYKIETLCCTTLGLALMFK